MNVKRYFAKDMQEAMARIREELGPDAVILSSKSVRKPGLAGLFSKPVLEVMVAYEDAKPPAPKGAPKPKKGAKAEPPPTGALERAVADKPKLLVTPTANSASDVAGRYSTQDPKSKTRPKQPAPVLAPLGAAVAAAQAAPASDNKATAAAKTPPQRVVIPGTATAFQANAPAGMPSAAAAIDEAFEKLDVQSATFRPLSELAKMPIPDAAQALKPPPRDAEAFSIQKAELLKPPKGRQKPPLEFDPLESNTLKSLDTRIVALDSLISAFSRRMQMLDGAQPAYEDDVQQLFERLCASEVEPQLAQALAAEAQKISKNRGVPGREVLEQIIKHTLGEPQPIRPLGRGRTVVMLMGPTGVGKTTSLVKLAAHFALNQDLRVGLINADTFRITAQEQLKTYADILGIPLDVIYSPDEVLEVMQKQADRDIIFIDTPGKRPSDERHKEDIARLIELTSPTELHLVLSASTGFASCSEIIRNYGFVPDYRIIATKLDETPARGVLLNVCHYSGRPLSYLATGQNVPDDIVLASADEITASIIG